MVSGYLTKQEFIAVAGVDDLIIRSLLDRRQFSDPSGEADREGISSATWPLFGLLWPSGAYLAARLALHPVCATERILEIGCGLGLASLVGHRRGADITASDRHPLTEGFLKENLRLNGLPPIKYRHSPWGTDGRPDQYDLIIGSDLLYEPDAKALLAGFISLHASPICAVWIVDPNRGNRPAFNRQMAAEGFRVSEESLNHPAAIGIAAYKGRMLTYQRAA